MGAKRAWAAAVALMAVGASSLTARAAAPAEGAPAHGTHVARGQVNVRALAAQEARAPKRGPRVKEPPEEGFPLRYLLGRGRDAQAPERSSAPSLSRAPSPVPGSSFNGIDNEPSYDAVPPDTHGAVGPSHVVTALNTHVRVADREGATLSTVTLDAFWAPVLPLADNDHFPFDPRLFYDPYYSANGTTGRWIVAAVYAFDTYSSVLIGVSQTADPTGTWNLFRVDADATNLLWADFPSVGFNKDWVVVQVNMFPLTTGSGRSQIYVFRKGHLYENTGATHTLFLDVEGFTQTPTVTNDANHGAIYLVEDWNGYNPSDGRGYLRMRTIGGTAQTPTLGAEVFVSSPSPWQDIPPRGFGGAQAGSSHKIDLGDARMQNCVYRNGSIWCAHTIFLPSSGTPNRSAVQWWQITPGGAVTQRGRIDDATGAKSFAYPSIAVNAFNDALLGYSRFGASQYASANYAFRSASDPANTFRSDTVLKAGEDWYHKTLKGTENRWGDYSAAMVDPADDATFWTVQEYARPRTGTGTSRWGTWWGRVDGVLFSGATSAAGAAWASFVSPVTGLTTANVVLRVPGTTTNIPASLSCTGATGTAVNCATGTVRVLALKPNAPLTPGRTYAMSVNPADITSPVTYTSGGATFPTSTGTFRFTVEEEGSAAGAHRWAQVSDAKAIGGSYVVERQPGAWASFTFSGTKIIWYTMTGPDQGTATVTIDGVSKGTFNQYSATRKYGVARTFTVPNGSHTIKVIATGAKGSSSGTDSRAVVDAFRAYPASGGNGTLFATPNLTTWWRSVKASAASAGRYAYGNMPNARVEITTWGTGIDLYTITSPHQGKVAVYDGNTLVAVWDNYSSATKFGVKRSIRGRANGLHTWRFVISSSRNAASRGTYIAIDKYVAV